MVSCAALHLSAPHARANINLELRPASAVAAPGSIVNLGLYAVSDSPFDQHLAAAQVIFNWNIAQVQLLGLDNSVPGTAPLLVSAFAPDPYGLNGPPGGLADGDGMWIGYAPLGAPVAATASGTLLTTLRFQTLINAAGPTSIDIIPTAGNPPGHTQVFDATIPNLNVVGTMSGATIQIVPGPSAPFFFVVVAVVRGKRRHRNEIDANAGVNIPAMAMTKT